MNELDLTATQVLETLQQAGYRATTARRAVVEAVLGREHHFTGGDIVAEVVESHRAVGRATVFRTLDVLVELGWLGRIHQPDGVRGYTFCSRDHHHHAICSHCGLVLELPGCPLTSEAGDDARAAGFQLHGHRLDFYGICRACQEKGVS